MKHLILITAMVALSAPLLLGQATYGKITPVGGFTASINQELTFTYQALSGSTFYWSAYPSVTTIPQTAVVFTTAINTGTVKVKFTQAMVAYVCVVRYKEGGMPAMECVTFNVVNCNAVATPGTITGPSPIAACGTYTYSVAAVAGASGYQWSGFVNGDKLTTTPTVTVDGTDFIIGANTLRVKSLNECGGSSALRTKSVTVNGIAAPASLTGPTTVSAGPTSLIYNAAAVTGATGYRWSGFIGGDRNTTGPTITVTAADLNTGTSTLGVKSIDACSLASVGSATLSVTLISLGTPGAISGPASLNQCGVSGTYTLAAVMGATSYIWSGLSTGDKTTTLPSVTIAHSDLVLGPNTLTVKASDGTIQSTASSLAVELNFPGQLVANPHDESPDFCTPQLSYSVTLPPDFTATSYTWSTNFGVNTTTAGPTFSFPANIVWARSNPTSPFAVTVFANGCVNLPAQFVVHPEPVGTHVINGPSTITFPSCSNKTFTVQNAFYSCVQYVWNFNGVTFNTPTNTITVDGFEIPGGSYTMTVMLEMPSGNVITTPIAVKSLSNLCGGAMLMASPNPSTSEIKLTGIRTEESPAVESEIRVLDPNGKQVGVYRTTDADFEIRDLALTPGVYVVEVTNASGQKQIRKVVMK